MNIDYLKNKKEIVPKILIVVSVIFAVTILIKTGAVFGDILKAKQIVKNAAERAKAATNKNTEYLAVSKEVVEELKKKNLFSPPPPSKKESVEGISGIFGDEALINGKWYKAGDKIEDAEIIAVEATQVRIMVDGKEKSFSPISAKGSDSNDQGQEMSSSRSSQRSGGSERNTGRGFGGRGGGISQEERDKIRNMSPEERRAYMIQRFRGRRN